MYQLATLHRDGPFALPVDDWPRARTSILQRWKECLGPLPPTTEPVHDVIDVHRLDDHEQLRIQYRTSDGDLVPALLLVPTGRRSGAGVLAMHPTVPSGKADVATTDGREGRRYGLDLVRRGHVVLAPDTITAGERVAPGAKPYHTADFVAQRPELSPIGKILADHRQGVSVLASLPGVHPGRIGVIGHSLGGYNAWFLASVDDRVAAVVSSCGYATFAGDHDLHHWGTRDWFSHFPQLSALLDQGSVPFEFHEVMALIAPRPVLNWLTTSDQYFPNWTESMQGLDQVHGLYQRLGRADDFVTWLGHGRHDFPAPVAETAYRFLERHLGVA
ncbi:dienelactone hydrolase family protein [Microlunatus sp. Y2014]|uniref:dienelactone hydrolase family protein n=1 Tax=Microlunatus sp. Y2014 TaxID=3418488 RepID=UPI003DA6E2A0